MNIDYKTWTPQQLFDEAFRLLNRADELLIGIGERCEARVAALKAADYSTLSAEDQHMLDAQLAHEAKMGLI